MSQQNLKQELKEINNSTLHNLRFLLESYSNEVLEAIDRQSTQQNNKMSDLSTLRKEVYSVVRTLKGIETVINHHTYTQAKVAS